MFTFVLAVTTGLSLAVAVHWLENKLKKKDGSLDGEIVDKNFENEAKLVG
jgi:hypothetical protein